MQMFIALGLEQTPPAPGVQTGGQSQDVPLAEQVFPPAQLPQLPPQPSPPQTLPLQFGWHTH